MIIVSVLYPNGSGSKFDLDYYLQRHMPMVQKRLGAPLKRVAVERGLAGGAPGAPPPFLAAGHLYFDSVEEFGAGFAEHGAAIQADIPNYTNTQPVIQISAVKM